MTAIQQDKIVKKESEWRTLLTPLEFKVTRKKGTERAFTGRYHNHKAKGTYVCVCCLQELFGSVSKFDSGTGWPSFWEPVNRAHIELVEDRAFRMKRIEVTCSRCDAHLGHVFKDGPEPTGLRYCINSAALDFVAKE